MNNYEWMFFNDLMQVLVVVIFMLFAVTHWVPLLVFGFLISVVMFFLSCWRLVKTWRDQR